MSTLPLNYTANSSDIKEFLRLGFALIPVNTPSPRGCTCIAGRKCGAPGKHPRISDWGKKWSKDTDVIRQWLTKWPDTNIGIITGEPSGIVVVDVDPRNGGVDALDDLQRKLGKLPETWTVLTGGGGYHYYFKYPVGVKLPKELCPGVDIKGDGGMVLAPGSLHVSGKRYEWEISSSPGEVELADLPQWVISYAANTRTTATKSAVIDPVYEEGGRNDKLTSLAGSMRKRGMSEPAILAALREENKEKCLPPLPDDEVQTIAKSAGRWEPDSPANHREDPWEPPIPFNAYDLPPFPVEALPDWLRNFIATVAIATQTPVDMAGLLALTMVGACVSRSVKVMARPGWIEPLNLYVLIVLAPGNRKSAVVAEIVAPMQEYEAELVQRMEPEYKSAKAKREAVEQALSIAKSAYAKARTASDRKGKTTPELEQAIEDLSQELSKTPEPVRVRLICDDITIERLAGLMAEQGGAMAMFTAEGGFVGMMAGRYSQGQSNFDIVLKAHSGEEIRVDRINRDPEFIKNPALSMAMAVQPAVLADLTSRPEFRGKGLNARFLYAVPNSNIGNRTIDPPAVPEHVRYTYKTNIKKLLKAVYPGDSNQSQVVSTLVLGDDAKDILREFETWLEPQLAGHGDLGTIQDWASKLAGAVVRVSGILHIAQNTDNPLITSTKIDAETMSAAIAIGQYLICHAKKAFDLMGANEDQDAAINVWGWIKSQCKQEFTRRDIYRSMHSDFKKPGDVDPVLDLLVAHGYIKETESKRKDQRKFLTNPIAVVPIVTVEANVNKLSQLSPFLRDVYVEKDIPLEGLSWNDIGREIDLPSREGGGQ